MNIFVTVGHTRFDSLFKQIDRISRDEWHFVSQIYDGKYIPKCGEYIAYTREVARYYENADVVITHAGAGTVYSLLEMGKTIIVVANSDRIDTHQDDLIRYVENSHFAQVCRDLSELEGLLLNTASFVAKEYKTDAFSGAKEICKKLGLTD